MIKRNREEKQTWSRVPHSLVTASKHMLLIVPLVLLASCATQKTSEETKTVESRELSQPTGSFKIIVLQGGFSTGEHLGYDLEGAWNILKEAPLNDSWCVIDENDIESYHWFEQEILLTEKASERIRDTAPPDSKLSVFLEMRPFVVTLRDERLYGGVILYPMSARGIGFPVLYINEERPKLKLSIRPYQGLIVDYRLARKNMDEDLKKRIEFSKVEDYFRALGKLGKYPDIVK